MTLVGQAQVALRYAPVSADNPKREPRRKNIRYKADPAECALMEFGRDPRAPFQGQLAGLIMDYSFHGCCVVAPRREELLIGAKLRVRLGVLDPLAAEVRWLVPIGDDLSRIGLYLP